MGQKGARVEGPELRDGWIMWNVRCEMFDCRCQISGLRTHANLTSSVSHPTSHIPTIPDRRTVRLKLAERFREIGNQVAGDQGNLPQVGRGEVACQAVDMGAESGSVPKGLGPGPAGRQRFPLGNRPCRRLPCRDCLCG